MKNKLHKSNTLCHAELDSASHHYLSKQRIKLLSFFLLTLFSIPTHAQPYQWTWATYGGSDAGFDGWDFRSEQVYDVVVGNDNNYYFLANIRRSSIGSSGSQLAGQPVTVYNNYSTFASDMFLFSTTCDGTVRWSQAIGGGCLMMLIT